MRTKLTPRFRRSFKILEKRYKSIENDFDALIKATTDGPTSEASHLGHGVYKIRLSIASKQAGKSGGARVIVAFRFEKGARIFLEIYDKGEKESLNENEFKAIIDDLTDTLDSLE